MTTEAQFRAGRTFTYLVEAHSTERLRKEATIAREGSASHNRWSLACDEPTEIGGDNSAPPPVSYLAASVAFCLLTQVTQFGHMMTVPVRAARAFVEIKWRSSGSVLAGTIAGHCDGVRVRLELESDAPLDRVAQLAANAERGCFVTQTIRRPVPVEFEARLAGSLLDLDPYSAAPDRERRSRRLSGRS